MKENMQEVLEWRADLLMAGHYAQLADQFLYPAMMHGDDGTQSVQDRDEMQAIFTEMRADMRRRGVSRIKVEVSAVSEVRHGRYQVRAIYHEYGASGWLIGQLNVVQYLMASAKGLRTVMTESLRQSAATVWPGDPAQAASGG